MLQRQIMFKQLQELQRRQQLQELGDTRNPDYINHLSSLKQGSAAQFVPTVKGAPVHDSQMLVVGSMEMMQHGGSAVFQGFPNGLVLPQSHNHALGPMGLSPPQFDISSYGIPASNTDRNLNLYSHLQGPSNLSAKNNNSPLGMSPIHPSAYTSSFMSQHGNFSSNQISMHMQDGSSPPHQVFQEKNLFGQVPAQSLSSDPLSLNYSQQGITMQRNTSVRGSDGRNEDTGWHGISLGKASKIGMSQSDTSLDPLEQKILYNTDDNSWESLFGRSSKMCTGAFDSTAENSSYIDSLPSIQSGSWSALMQSAVTETSSSDTAIQEEWSGLSFQNPEPSTDNQPSSFVNIEKPQSNHRVDRNLQNVSSPSSEPEQFQKSNINCSFPGFQQSGNQYLKQKDEFHSETSHASGQQSPRNTSQLAINNFQQKHPIGGSQLVQTSLSSLNAWPAAHYKENLKTDAHQSNAVSCTNEKTSINFSGDELRGTFWLHGSTSNSTSDGIQKPFDQVNRLNIHRYSVGSDVLAPGENFAPVSALSGVSSDLRSQDVTVQSENMLELLNKDDISHDHAPGMQFNSKVSSLTELPLTETSDTSFAKPCDSSPVSQGFGFRLGTTDARISQSHSFFPSLSMENSSATSLSRDYMNDCAKIPHPATPGPSHKSMRFPAYSGASSQVNFQSPSANSDDPEFPLLENVSITQPSGASVVLQNGRFPAGLATPLQGITTQQDVSYTKPYKSSSNLFQSPDSASSSIETNSGAPNEQPNQNLFKHERSVQEYGAFSGKLGYHEQGSHKESSLHEGSTRIHNETSLRSTHTQESFRNHHSEADDFASGSRDIRDCGHSMHRSYPMLHQLHSPRNAETDRGKRLLLNYDGINYQQAITASELLLSGQKLIVKDKAEGDPEAVQTGSFLSGDKGWNFSQENHSGKASPAAYMQNFQQMKLLGQNNFESRSTGSNEASNTAYQSQISLQMAPSWFKQYGTLNNGQVFPKYNAKAAINAARPLSGLNTGNLQENSLIKQVNSANASQGSGTWPSSAATLIASKHLSPPSMLPSNASCQNLGVPKLKKRKIVSFDMAPWYKEVHHEAMSLQDPSRAELEWAQASNRRKEEAKHHAEIVEDVFPLVRAKRRLIFSSQLMQQVFRPAPGAILFADASSNCDYVAYYAARIALGDACNLTRKPPSDTTDMLPDQLETYKRSSACDLSKVVEGIIGRVKKLEDTLSRLDRSLSIVDIKVESQELEKFSTINRFAKFHIRAHPSTVDTASSSGPSTVQKISPQRYVISLPMPRTLPEDIDCLSL